MKIGIVTTQRAKSEFEIFGINLRQQSLVTNVIFTDWIFQLLSGVRLRDGHRLYTAPCGIPTK